MTKQCTMLFLAVLALTLTAAGQSWTPVPNFLGQGAGTAILRSDGTVMVEEMTGQASQGGFATGNWFLLLPNENNSYLLGTWAEIQGLPAGYAPLYFASAVLPNASVIVEGGEYNLGSQSETIFGAIFNWDLGTWSSVGSPIGWTEIGDAPSVVLPDNSFMLGDCCSTQEAILNINTMTWKATGKNKADPNSEEGGLCCRTGEYLRLTLRRGDPSQLKATTQEQENGRRLRRYQSSSPITVETRR